MTDRGHENAIKAERHRFLALASCPARIGVTMGPARQPSPTEPGISVKAVHQQGVSAFSWDHRDVSQWVWGVPVIVLILGVVLWSVLWTKHVVKDLASRPEREYQIAGVDRVSELQRASLIGIGPWRMHRLRGRLDRAAADLARYEEGRQPG